MTETSRIDKALRRPFYKGAPANPGVKGLNPENEIIRPSQKRKEAHYEKNISGPVEHDGFGDVCH
ncbi:MAG: hypothetical protein KFF50_11080, partial [Desulfatitalea sp.]|nr:hypothetical protein [Desulfatitalea sp.]